jgi:glucuronate isomerase
MLSCSVVPAAESKTVNSQSLMKDGSLVQMLEEGLAEIPVLDVHTHLSGAKLGARGLHDILLYHMVVSDLYSAGCPSGARLTQFPHWPSAKEAHQRIQEALPYLPAIRNTSGWWGVGIILRDLYGFDEPLTRDNWRRLDDQVRERADDGEWARSILRRVQIQRSCAEYSRRGKGEGDDVLQYSLEWGMFMRAQWNEFDTAVYDLERTWGRAPEAPLTIGGGPRVPADRIIRTLDDVHGAIQHYVDSIPYSEVISTAMAISSEVDFRLPGDDEVTAALQHRDRAGPVERDIYAAYIGEVFLSALEKNGKDILFQFTLGAEPLPYETASRIYQKALGQLAEIIARHPKLRFQCLVSSVHANQTLCTMCRELPNLSLAGYWWHNFFPGAIRHVLNERLDMVPANKQIGFFSDAYVAEWAYANAIIVRKQMAEVFAAKVRQGQYTVSESLTIAREILFETPQTLAGMTPEQGKARR